MLRLSLVAALFLALTVSVAGTPVRAEVSHHENLEDARPVTVLLNGDPWCEGWLVHDICWIPVRQIADLLGEPVHVEWQGPATVQVVTDFDHREGEEEFAEEEWRDEEGDFDAEQEWREHEPEMERDDEDEERLAHDVAFALRQLAADREHAERRAQILMQRERDAVEHARNAVEKEIHLELERELKRLEHERVQVELEAQLALHREVSELEHAYHQTESEIRLDLENELRRIGREEAELRHHLDSAASWDPDESEEELEEELEREEREETEGATVGGRPMGTIGETADVPQLPSGPPGPGPFGAYYTRLTFTPEWDAPWRVDDHADVVVRFDNGGHRFVFWRGTSYIPCWVTGGGPLRS